MHLKNSLLSSALLTGVLVSVVTLANATSKGSEREAAHPPTKSRKNSGCDLPPQVGRIKPSGINRDNYSSLTLNKAPARQGTLPIQEGDWSSPSASRPQQFNSTNPLRIAIGIGHPADPRLSLDDRGSPGTLGKEGKTLRDPRSEKVMSAEGIYNRAVAHYFFERLRDRNDIAVKLVHEKNLQKQAQKVAQLERKGFEYYELHTNAAPGTSGVMVGSEITWLDVGLARQIGAFSQEERQNYLIPSKDGTIIELRPLDGPTSEAVKEAAKSKDLSPLKQFFSQDWENFKRGLDFLKAKSSNVCQL